MGEKGFRSASSGALSMGCCDMTVKCRCRWRWDHAILCSYWREQQHNPSCLLSSTLVFFISSFLVFGALGMVFAWLTFSPFSQPLFDSTELACQHDNEGSWSIGIYFGDSPLSLQPIELENIRNDKGSAWPVANPVLTCASVTDASHPSAFVADPFLYLQGSKMYIFFETKNALTKQGDIGVAETSDGGASWNYLGVALDEEWHLSFPYVFSYNGQVPCKPHLDGMRCTVWYLEAIVDYALFYEASVSLELYDYTDADWIGSIFDKRSSGFMFSFGSAIVTEWQEATHNCLVKHIDRV